VPGHGVQQEFSQAWLSLTVTLDIECRQA